MPASITWSLSITCYLQHLGWGGILPRMDYMGRLWGTFFRLEVYKKVGISWAEVWKRGQIEFTYNQILLTCTINFDIDNSSVNIFPLSYLNTYHDLGIKVQSFVVFFQNLFLPLGCLFFRLQGKLWSWLQHYIQIIEQYVPSGIISLLLAQK